MDLLELYSEIVHEPAVKVFCWTCGLHIYNLDELPIGDTPLRSSLFKPARSDIRPPEPRERARCPLCGGDFISPQYHLLTEPFGKGL